MDPDLSSLSTASSSFLSHTASGTSVGAMFQNLLGSGRGENSSVGSAGGMFQSLFGTGNESSNNTSSVSFGGSNLQNKRVPCPICGNETAKTYLATHLRTHTGEKPFACRYCNYRTGDRSNLNHHMLRHKFQSNNKNWSGQF